MPKTEALIRDYADLGVSVGYIGNLEPWGDDRRWSVFTKLRWADSRRSVSIDIPGPDFDDAYVRTRLDFIRRRLAQHPEAFEHVPSRAHAPVAPPAQAEDEPRIRIDYDDGRPSRRLTRQQLRREFEERADAGNCPEPWQEAFWASLDCAGSFTEGAGVTYTDEGWRRPPETAPQTTPPPIDRFQVCVYATTGRWSPAPLDPGITSTRDHWTTDMTAAVLASLRAIQTGAPRVVLRDAADSTCLLGERGKITLPEEYAQAQRDVGLPRMIAVLEERLNLTPAKAPARSRDSGIAR